MRIEIVNAPVFVGRFEEDTFDFSVSGELKVDSYLKEKLANSEVVAFMPNSDKVLSLQIKTE